MIKIAGSRSTIQRHGSADPDPDPHQNVTDPQHWFKVVSVENDSKPSPIRALFLKMVTSTDYKIAGLFSGHNLHNDLCSGGLSPWRRTGNQALSFMATFL